MIFILLIFYGSSNNGQHLNMKFGCRNSTRDKESKFNSWYVSFFRSVIISRKFRLLILLGKQRMISKFPDIVQLTIVKNNKDITSHSLELFKNMSGCSRKC